MYNNNRKLNMRILIFGANGKTGLELVKQALDQKHKVTAYVRRTNAINIKHSNLELIVGDLNETAKIDEAIYKSDVCISALGGKSLRRHAIEIRNGIENIVSSLKKYQEKKFIYLSSIGASESRFYMKQPMRFIICDLILKVPLFDHTLNETLIKSKVPNWTIIQPGSLHDKDLSSKLVHSDKAITLKGNPTISRASVASFILQQAASNTYLNKSVWLYEH